MKIYFVQYILSVYTKKWEDHYYLADFILTHILAQRNFYYNFNMPDFFSINGKNGLKIPFCDFIDSVANIPRAEVNHSINLEYFDIVQKLIESGAPQILFHSAYQKKC